MIGLASGFALVLLSGSLLLACFRLVKGPSLPDRVVALELIAIVLVGFTAVLTVRSGLTVYLDVAVVVGLLSFMGTIAFARYLERRATE